MIELPARWLAASSFMFPLAFAACAAPEREQREEAVAEKPKEKPKIEFAGDDVFASLGGERWKLPAPKDEIFFSPSQTRYAMVDLSSAPDAPPTRLLVRTLRGRIIASILFRQPGMPREVAWIDERRIGYVEPKGDLHPTDLYRTHEAESGRLIHERAGSSVAWDPAKRRIAYLARDGRAVAVGDKEIYPRTRTPRARFRGPIAWSPDGHGLAFIELGDEPKLVVLVELEDESGDLSWPIPPEATAPSLRVFWASANKVIIGEDPMSPKFAGNWEREK